MEIYEPTDGEFANNEAGIVLLNQFGATVSQDTGRDGCVMADTFRLPVIAVNRPGTAGFMPHPKLARELSSPAGYLAHMAHLGKDIDKQAERLGIERLLVTGRSAGGLGALALARSETVTSINAVFAAEPVGCEQMPLNEGKKRYADYLKQQKKLLKSPISEGLVKPLSPGLSFFPAVGRIVSIPPAALYDRFNNQELFATNAACEYATYIAEELDSVDTTLEFAEHSMVATPEVYERDILPIADLRETGAPFMVRQPTRTVHASFDNREYMNRVMVPTVVRALLAR